MKVILLKDVASLGKAGDLKDVKDGYGNNFLIKRGLAKNATKENIRRLDSDKKRQEVKEKQSLEIYKNQKIEMEEKVFMLKHKLSKNGSLYGAITKNEIADFMEQSGIKIDKKNIDIQTPIKTSGLHEIDIKLGQGIHATLKLEIIGEG